MKASGPILVDTSVWIDFFAPRPGPGGRELRRMVADAAPILLTGIVVVEVLQGLVRDVATIERFLAQWDLLEPGGFEIYARAAGLYRRARSNALTLTTVDALIATLAIENNMLLFTLDRDFARLAQFAPLKLYSIH